MVNWDAELERLSRVVQAYGIRVVSRTLPSDIPGTFDGVSIAINDSYDAETQCHVLAHCFGHSVQWGSEALRYRSLYDRLYVAKENRNSDRVALTRALDEFRAYEEEASEYAAFLIRDNPEATARYTNFARADIEAIVAYHRDGTAPPWPTFWADWNERLAHDKTVPRPFAPRPIPPFRPTQISEQEVIQVDEPAAADHAFGVSAR